MDNYDRIIEKISKKSGVSMEELERKVEAKRAKLSGLISKEGAAQVIAAELGISFDNEILKLEELLPGMRKVNVIGKVVRISPVRTFKTKKGDDGKVTNLFIADNTSNIKVVLWDTHHISLIEEGKVGEGVVVEIVNGSMRDNELHLGSFSELKITNHILEDIKTDKIFREKKIAELKISENSKIRGFIVQSFEPRFFYICPTCRKKATQEGNDFVCAEHGRVAPEKRALLNIVIDDGTETIRAVAFHDNLPAIGITSFDNPEALAIEKANIIGKELFLFGAARNNKFSNTLEFGVDKVEEIDLDKMISELENH